MSKHFFNTHLNNPKESKLFKTLFLDNIEKEFYRRKINVVVENNVIKFNRMKFNPSKNYYNELFNFFDEGKITLIINNSDVKISVLHKPSKLIFTTVLFSLIFGGFFWVRTEISTLTGIITIFSISIIYYLIGFFLIKNGFRKVITKCISSSKAKIKIS